VESRRPGEAADGGADGGGAVHAGEPDINDSAQVHGEAPDECISQQARKGPQL
jgi:hypothetical protein